MQLSKARAQYVRWLAVTRDLSPHTIRAYGGDLAEFERFLGSRTEVREIEQDDFIAYLESQKQAGLSPASLRRRASALRGFCRWMLAQGLVETDPGSGARVAVGRSRRLPRVLPAREVQRLIEFLELRVGLSGENLRDAHLVEERPHEATTLLAVAMMVTTGVRVNEMVDVRCDDIDLSGRAIRLVGKGRRERQVFFTNDWITALAGAYLEARSTIGLQHPYLLFNLHYDPLTPSTVRARLAKAASAAGLTTHVTPHVLRHTAATQLIEAGVDIRYIQRLLGHASLSTTEIYTHVSDRALRRVVSDADVLGRFVQAR